MYEMPLYAVRNLLIAICLPLCSLCSVFFIIYQNEHVMFNNCESTHRINCITMLLIIILDELICFVLLKNIYFNTALKI